MWERRDKLKEKLFSKKEPVFDLQNIRLSKTHQLEKNKLENWFISGLHLLL